MLKSIIISQFKRFSLEEIEFAPLTLLTGINGMGKSSVIQALLLLRQSFDRGELQNHSRLVIEDKDLANMVSPNDMLFSGAKDNIVSFELLSTNGDQAKWSVKAEGSSNTLPVKSEELKGSMYGGNLFNEAFQYLNAERLGPRVIYDRLTVSRSHSPLGYNGEYTANFILEMLTDLRKTELQLLAERSGKYVIYELLSYWVSEIIYPGTKVSVNDRSTHLQLKFAFDNEPVKTFDPVNVGFGFSYALPVILALIIAKPGSLLIIENPEAHLHPKGQSKIGMLMALAAASGVQIIAETHSDHVLNGIRVLTKGASKLGKIDSFVSKVHFFHETLIDNGIEAKKRTLDILPNGKLTGWPKNFFDEWESNLRLLIKT